MAKTSGRSTMHTVRSRQRTRAVAYGESVPGDSVVVRGSEAEAQPTLRNHCAAQWHLATGWAMLMMADLADTCSGQGRGPRARTIAGGRLSSCPKLFTWLLTFFRVKLHPNSKVFDDVLKKIKIFYFWQEAPSDDRLCKLHKKMFPPHRVALILTFLGFLVF